MNADTIKLLNEKYKRISDHIDFMRLFDVEFIFVGVGAITPMIVSMVRMGAKKVTLIDPDVVEEKNIATQGFNRKHIGMPKVDALAEILQEVDFEHTNPAVPPLRLRTLHRDFLSLTDEEITQGSERSKIMITTTDYHPAQARANRLSLANSIPCFWIGIYRGATAGEIIFTDPGASTELPCYWCITKSRYAFFDKNHLADHLMGIHNGIAASSGLPFAASFIDSIAAHLIIGCIHKDSSANPHGAFYRRLLEERRNFIQVQLDPNYRMKGENIFAQLQGPDVLSFNTLFQQDIIDDNCPDCKQKWIYSDYTQEFRMNYHPFDGGYFRNVT